MKDIESYRALFTRTHVFFEEFRGNAGGHKIPGDHVVISIPAVGRPDTVNDGYSGFAADLTFDGDGKLVKFGIWE